MLKTGGYLILLATIIFAACAKPDSYGSSLDEITSNPELAPDKLLEMTGLLKDIGIFEGVKEEELALITAEIRSGQLKTPTAVLAKSGKVIVVDETEIKVPAPGHYVQLYDALLKFSSNISVESSDASFIEVDEYDGTKAKRILVKILAGGNSYERINYYSEKTLVDSGFYKIINRLLAERNSAYRIYRIDLYCNECNSSYYVSTSSATYKVDGDRFGLILLSEEQASYIFEEEILGIDKGEHDLLSTRQIEETIQNFEGLGLFKHLSDDEIGQAQEMIFKSDIYDTFTILGFFPNVLYGFDTETSNFDNPYEEITLGMAALTKGKFDPKNIKDKFEYDKFSEFSFEFAGKKYEIMLETTGDWLDTSLIEFINKVLAENLVNGEFYIIESGQYVDLIFLEPEQYAALKSIVNGLERAGQSKAVDAGKSFEDLVAARIERDYNLNEGQIERNVRITS